MVELPVAGLWLIGAVVCLAVCMLSALYITLLEEQIKKLGNIQSGSALSHHLFMVKVLGVFPLGMMGVITCFVALAHMN